MRAPLSHPGAWLAALAMAGSAPAQAASDDQRLQALEQQLALSLAQIAQLQQRLAALDGRGAAMATAPGAATATAVAGAPAAMPAATSAAAGAPAAAPIPAGSPAANAAGQAEAGNRLATMERSLGELSAALAAAKPAGDGGVPLHGFLDLNWAQRSRSDPGRNGFQLGVLDFYLSPQFGTHVRSLIELAFEYGSDGGLAVDAERLQIGWEVNDRLLLWAGRFHTPYGYWNTAFHHGAQIQTSITRPRFIAFEDQGGILPAHSVGAWATGKLATGWGRLGYDLYLGNGNRISDGVLDFNAAGDDNASPLLGFNLSLQPAAVPGLTVGLHGLRQKVSGDNAEHTASGSARSSFLGGYAFFENDDWELIGEYYRFRNRDLGATSDGRTLGSWAGYLQAGYSLAPRWVAFMRAEKAALNAADPYFALQGSGRSYQQWSTGLRFELDPRAALKLQLDSSRDQATATSADRIHHQLRAQYAIRF